MIAVISVLGMDLFGLLYCSSRHNVWRHELARKRESRTNRAYPSCSYMHMRHVWRLSSVAPGHLHMHGGGRCTPGITLTGWRYQGSHVPWSIHDASVLLPSIYTDNQHAAQRHDHQYNIIPNHVSSSPGRRSGRRHAYLRNARRFTHAQFMFHEIKRTSLATYAHLPSYP